MQCFLNKKRRKKCNVNNALFSRPGERASRMIVKHLNIVLRGLTAPKANSLYELPRPIDTVILLY